MTALIIYFRCVFIYLLLQLRKVDLGWLKTMNSKTPTIQTRKKSNKVIKKGGEREFAEVAQSIVGKKRGPRIESQEALKRGIPVACRMEEKLNFLNGPVYHLSHCHVFSLTPKLLLVSLLQSPNSLWNLGSKTSLPKAHFPTYGSSLICDSDRGTSKRAIGSGRTPHSKALGAAALEGALFFIF